MTQTIKVFGHEVELDLIKINVTAVGEGYTVTGQVLLNDDDLLFAVTRAQNPATLEEATTTLMKQVSEDVHAWLDANEE